MYKHSKILDLESNICIYYNSSSKIIYAEWVGSQTQLQQMNGYEMVLQCLKENNCPKILNDTSRISCNWNQALDWVTSDWIIRCCKAGLKYMAWVSSTDPACWLTPDQEARCNRTGCITITFQDVINAQNWLKTV